MKEKLLKVSGENVIPVTEDTRYILIREDYSVAEPCVYEFLFNTSGVTAELVTIYKTPKKGNFDVTTIAHHTVPNTNCVTKVRGILGENSISNYIGKIIIDKAAQQTSSFLFDNVLVIGENTKNNSQPILEIDADDVSASHGATTGKVDDDEVYYLMSRGLSKDEAVKLISDGFLDALIDLIETPEIKKEVLESIKR